MNNSIFLRFYDYGFIILGNICYAVGIVGFLQPADISPGGITGVATILNYLFSLPTGTMLFLLNLPLLIAGLIKLGAKFILKTLFSTAVSSVAIDMLSVYLPKLSQDRIICSLAGGVLMGAGMAMILLHGATSGGTDIGAKLLQLKYPYVPMGRLILFMDAVVITLSALAYKNLESALYSVLAILVSTTIIDKMMYGSGGGKVAFIITEKPQKLKREILEGLKRGVTEISTSGGYSGNKKTMLMCAVRRQQTGEMHRIIKLADNSAFVVFADAGEIMGRGFTLENK